MNGVRKMRMDLTKVMTAATSPQGGLSNNIVFPQLDELTLCISQQWLSGSLRVLSTLIDLSRLVKLSLTINNSFYYFSKPRKISILNWIKCEQSSQEDDNEVLSFPIHHKHAGDSHLSPVQTFDDIEKTILDAFNQALKLTQPLEISKLLKEHDIFELNSLSKYVFQ
ncbi:unnamed protein product [Rotaria sordida]|nr:unnamed protein product [Rotaria sordida]